MRSRREAASRAQQLLDEAQGLLGPRAVHGIVGQLLPFIEELRDSGASWEQIAGLLQDAGLRSRLGEAVGADSLRATVSRVRPQAVANLAGATAKPARARSVVANPGQDLGHNTVPETSRSEPRDRTRSREGESLTLSADDRADDLRARMKRAASIRGSIGDTSG